MKKYTFKELEVGRIYEQDDCGWAGMFVGMRNDYLATFKDCEYDEESGYIPTDKESYLTERECRFEC